MEEAYVCLAVHSLAMIVNNYCVKSKETKGVKHVVNNWMR